MDPDDEAEGLPTPARVKLLARRAAGIAEAQAVLSQLPAPGESLHAVVTARMDLTDVFGALLQRYAVDTKSRPRQGRKNAQIYGGARRDVKSAHEWFSDNWTPANESDLQQDIGVVVGVGLVGLDVPLSTIGDTLTLPAAILGSNSHRVSRENQRRARCECHCSRVHRNLEVITFGSGAFASGARDSPAHSTRPVPVARSS
jgi:hypothetical protein